MGSINKNEILSAALFGKTRRAVLALLYSHVDEPFYLRQIVRSAGAGMGAVQRELKRLSDSGIITRTVKGQQVYYMANPECPIYDELKSLVQKTNGIGDILDELVRRVLKVVQPKRLILFGSAARGGAGSESDLDLLVVMPDGIHRRRTAQIIYRSLTGLGVAKDILVVTESDVKEYAENTSLVLYPALREGKELYRAAG